MTPTDWYPTRAHRHNFMSFVVIREKCYTVNTWFLLFDFRAVHTNYDAKFTCESIKLAAIKNRWLAKRLGGDMYSVVFKYEQGTAP